MRKSLERLKSNQAYVAEYFEKRTLDQLLERARKRWRVSRPC
jgi:hypothetical protein